MKRWLCAVGSVAVGVVMAACTTNPTTGRSQLNLLSRDQEISMGSEAQPQLTQEFGGEVQDEQLQAYVTEVGQKLAAVTEGDNPSLPWEFTLLNSGVINAFALPGGKVFITRGLAEKLTTEAQLAGVLGHECGHVTARHINDQMTRQMGLGAAVAVAGAAIGQGGAAIAQAGGTLGNIVLLKFSRDQEDEADSLGMRYMTRVGYNPAGQLQVMEVLQEASQQGGAPPEFLSTHPYPESRIQRIQKLLGTEFKNADGQDYAEQYQQRMLARLAKLPPAPKPEQQRGLAPGQDSDRAVAWAGGTGCPLCRGH